MSISYLGYLFTHLGSYLSVYPGMVTIDMSGLQVHWLLSSFPATPLQILCFQWLGWPSSLPTSTSVTGNQYNSIDNCFSFYTYKYLLKSLYETDFDVKNLTQYLCFSNIRKLNNNNIIYKFMGLKNRRKISHKNINHN